MTIRRQNKLSALLAGAMLLICAGVFGVYLSQLQPIYDGFLILRWEDGCGASPKAFKPSGERITDTESQPRCLSKPFFIPGKVLEFQQDIRDRSQRIQLEMLGGGSPEILFDSTRDKALRISFGKFIYLASVGPSNIGEKARLAISPEPSPPEPSLQKPWLSVRSRVNYYHMPPSFLTTLRDYFSSHRYGRWGLYVLFAFSLVLLGVKAAGEKNPSSVFFLGLLAVSVAVHFRPAVYFYWDEWHTLEHFKNTGLHTALMTHNEHLIPLFFLFYYAEVLLFSDNYSFYILTSILIHAFNAYLFSELLFRLIENRTREVPRALALLYAISALHSEALEWAFIQPLLLSETLLLAALVLGWDFLHSDSGRKTLLLPALVCVSLAPLFFGNGFSNVLQLGLVVAFAAIVKTGKREEMRVMFWKGATLLFWSFLVMLLPLAFYLYFREGAGHSYSEATPFSDLEALRHYLLVGSGLGTILRELGLYPSLPSEARLLDIPSWLPASFNPDRALAKWGYGLSSIFLAGVFFCRRRFRYLALWTLGHGMILSSLLLPALGRWKFGTLQSLSLRYHTLSLLGFFVMVLPFCSVLFERISKSPPRLRRYLFSALALLVTIQTASQLHLAATYSYFTKRGATNRDYLEKLKEWYPIILGDSNPRRTTLGRTVEEQQSLMPLPSKVLTPDRFPREIYDVAHWLGRTPVD